MPASPIVARISKSDYRRTVIAFRSALALAQLGRADEARRAYADGIKHHGLSPTPQKLRDLGGAISVGILPRRTAVKPSKR
jgi:hypothetical protein